MAEKTRIDELRLDSLSKLSTVYRQWSTFCPHLGTFFGRAASLSSEAGFGLAEEFIQVTAR